MILVQEFLLHLRMVSGRVAGDHDDHSYQKSILVNSAPLRYGLVRCLFGVGDGGAKSVYPGTF